MRVEFFHTHIAPAVADRVTRVLQSGRLSEGQVVQEFEAALQRQLGVIGPVAVNSGTSALHLALSVAGVGPGDEVILPPQTFIASGLVIVMQGARPVFADIHPRTGTLNPASVRAAITPRTKAIMPVHWGGYPCELEALNALAADHGLAVIEDAAHALGATYRGTPIGAVSRFTAFSFQAIKHLTTGDGGALCCRRAADYETARRRRWFGIDRANTRVSLLGERRYDATELGYKYHLNDLAAAVGLGNVEDFPSRLRRRQAIAARYRAALREVPGITLMECREDRTHAYWLFTVLVERRAAFVRALKGRGIPASVVNQRIDRHPLFGGCREALVGQTEFEARQVSIPIHDGLTDDDAEAILAAVQAGW